MCTYEIMLSDGSALVFHTYLTSFSKLPSKSTLQEYFLTRRTKKSKTFQSSPTTRYVKHSSTSRHLLKYNKLIDWPFPSVLPGKLHFAQEWILLSLGNRSTTDTLDCLQWSPKKQQKTKRSFHPVTYSSRKTVQKKNFFHSYVEF